MYPILLNTKYITIFSWGFMVALGYLASIIVSIYLAKKDKFQIEYVLGAYIYTALFAIIGARLFFVIQFFDQYIKQPIQMIMIQRGGLVFFGGFIAASIAVYIYSKINKLDFLRVLDVMSPGILLGYTIGRIGCFLNACCYGIVSTVPWGVKFPGEEFLRHPTQLYSSVSALLIFAILIYIFNKKKYNGHVFVFAVLLYSGYRFIVEFYRYSPAHFIGLTPSQIIAILLMITSVYILWKKK